MEAIQAPLIVFLVIVAPIWIAMHYRHKNKSKPLAAESMEDKKKIEELLAMAEKMENRIETLESILDRQDANWRHDV
ncbi:phage shock protein B [Alteromonadaceae bacterium Bs31]|nr:phage shock protein B [Alteromonadaceae bacterium Bs31]